VWWDFGEEEEEIMDLWLRGRIIMFWGFPHNCDGYISVTDISP